MNFLAAQMLVREALQGDTRQQLPKEARECIAAQEEAARQAAEREPDHQDVDLPEPDGPSDTRWTDDFDL